MARFKKPLLLLLAVALLIGASQVQTALNHDRQKLGLTRIEPLENAPPVLAFTTVALGGFRGLISNFLWIRANELQDEDKYFEMAQLADWITKLEPHFVQVWVNQAWNMAYNISVKFTDLSDRWNWVKRGIELLRDDGLRYNPNEVLIYRELAWFFQHKMGANLDDGHTVYKQQWANEMAVVFGNKTPDLEELINPQTPDQKRRADLLRNKYKMDPVFMKEVNERYGPLEWRLPESHAIYWAAVGLERARENPSKVKKDDLITLRRVIYQSMLLSFQRGRMIMDPIAKKPILGPNLEIIPKVDKAYVQAAAEDAEYHDHILRAHRNFLKDAVYFLYMYNRRADAAQWYSYLGNKYPDQLLTSDTNSYPANVSVDRYAVDRVQEDVSEGMAQIRIKGVLEGLISTAYESLILGEDERAAGYKAMAKLVQDTYRDKTSVRAEPLKLESIEEIQSEVLARMLDPEKGLPAEARAILRSKLALGPEEKAPAAGTNAVPQKVSSN